MQTTKLLNRKHPSAGVAKLGAIALALAFVLDPEAASAGLIVSSGTTANGESVDAKTTFTFSTDTITIKMENLIVDQTDVGQSVTGFAFQTGGVTTGSTLTSSSGTIREINSNNTFTDLGSTPNGTGWGFGVTSNTLTLNWFTRDKAITGPNSEFTLIGQPGGNSKYNNADGSLTNSAHSPELAGPLTFTLHVAGITAATTGANFSNFVFSFGTTSLTTATSNGSPQLTPLTAAPEPSTIASATLGVGLVCLLRRRRSKAVPA